MELHWSTKISVEIRNLGWFYQGTVSKFHGRYSCRREALRAQINRQIGTIGTDFSQLHPPPPLSDRRKLDRNPFLNLLTPILSPDG
jgi:hypothetical protein